jgi:hyperosmotically inducible protein
VRDHIAEAATAERLRATLLENFREEALSFRIEVEEDLATITGKVRSVMTPAAVSRVARTVDGIRRVDNRLVAPTEAKVSGDAEPAREKEEISPAIHDAILTARVRAALLDARKAAALELTVTAKDGAVLLTGKAAGAAEREGALAVAKKVRGVRKATAEGVQVPPPPAPPTTSATAVPKGTK